MAIVLSMNNSNGVMKINEVVNINKPVLSESINEVLKYDIKHINIINQIVCQLSSPMW